VDANTLYQGTVDSWTSRVGAIRDDDWGEPTPCTDWTVRDLVNHLAYEDLWTPETMHGRTIEEVGDRFEGDLLGDQPVATSLAAAAAALRAVEETLPADGLVYLSYGEERAEEYVRQLAADHLVHSWDMAVATGGDPHLDRALVAEVAGWYADREDIYRQMGAVQARTGSWDDPQAQLLSAFGRNPEWSRGSNLR
jgi:uncharacterized protein (TIGR03086 family)